MDNETQDEMDQWGEKRLAEGWRPRAKIHLDPAAVVALLELPAGTRVTAVQGRFDPMGIEIVVENDEWDLVDPTTESPYRSCYVEQQTLEHEGETFVHRAVRWGPDLSGASPDERPPFAFDPDENGDLSLESAVMQALGAATTCWDNLAGAGVFHSERARDIGLALIEEIRVNQ